MQQLFKTPYGELDFSQARVITRKDGTDIIAPYPKHPNLQLRQLHHHLYFDRQRVNTIGLAYTHYQNNQAWREYFIDRGYGWEKVGESQRYASVRELNQVSQNRAQIRALERQVQGEVIRRSAAPKSQAAPNAAASPTQRQSQPLQERRVSP